MRILQYTQALAFVLCCSAVEGVCVAEDFRIESKVYVGEEETEPVNKTLTLFYAGRVYDFLGDPAEVTVFDPQRQRFLLLNPAKRQRVEITLDYVTALTANLQERGQNRDDPLVRFMSNPRFVTAFDAATDELTLTSEWMTYAVKTAPANSEIASKQYTLYADAYAHLNTLVSPAHLPPFARLELNRALERRGELPKEVTLTVTSPSRIPGKSESVVIRSVHHVAWKLLESDRERIEQTGRALSEYSSVDLAEYQRPATEQAQR